MLRGASPDRRGVIVPGPAGVQMKVAPSEVLQSAKLIADPNGHN